MMCNSMHLHDRVNMNYGKEEDGEMIPRLRVWVHRGGTQAVVIVAWTVDLLGLLPSSRSTPSHIPSPRWLN